MGKGEKPREFEWLAWGHIASRYLHPNFLSSSLTPLQATWTYEKLKIFMLDTEETTDPQNGWSHEPFKVQVVMLSPLLFKPHAWLWASYYLISSTSSPFVCLFVFGLLTCLPDARPWIKTSWSRQSEFLPLLGAGIRAEHNSAKPCDKCRWHRSVPATQGRLPRRRKRKWSLPGWPLGRTLQWPRGRED